MSKHPNQGWDTPYKVHDPKLAVSEDVRNRRILICVDCKKFKKFVCMESKTFLPPFTWLTFTHCPLDKW